MKRTKKLAALFGIWILVQLGLLFSYSVGGLAIIAYAWPITIGLGVAIFISYFKEKKVDWDSQPPIDLVHFAWMVYLFGVLVVLILVILVAYMMFFNFSYR